MSTRISSVGMPREVVARTGRVPEVSPVGESVGEGGHPPGRQELDEEEGRDERRDVGGAEFVAQRDGEVETPEGIRRRVAAGVYGEAMEEAGDL